jgi:hypothetical protein
MSLMNGQLGAKSAMKWIKNPKSLGKNIQEKVDKFMSINESYESPASDGITSSIEPCLKVIIFTIATSQKMYEPWKEISSTLSNVISQLSGKNLIIGLNIHSKNKRVMTNKLDRLTKKVYEQFLSENIVEDIFIEKIINKRNSNVIDSINES